MSQPVKHHIAWMGGIGRAVLTLIRWVIIGAIIGVGVALLTPGPRFHVPWTP